MHDFPITPPMLFPFLKNALFPHYKYMQILQDFSFFFKVSPLIYILPYFKYILVLSANFGSIYLPKWLLAFLIPLICNLKIGQKDRNSRSNGAG